jgi:hypothetical protein
MAMGINKPPELALLIQFILPTILFDLSIELYLITVNPFSKHYSKYFSVHVEA